MKSGGTGGFCGGIAVGVETLPNALGSKAYVHFVALGAEDAVNEGCVYAGEGLCEGIQCSRHGGSTRCVFLRHFDRLCSESWYIYGYAI